MKYPKLIFFDIDGTLVNSRGKITTRTREQIERLREEGVAISLASGRPLFGAQQIISELGINAPCVFFSAALVIEPQSGERLYEAILPKEEVLHIIEGTRELGIYTELYNAEEYFVERVETFTEMHAGYLDRRPVVRNLEDVLQSEQILKVVMVVRRGVEESVLREFIRSNPNFHYGVATGASHPDILFANATHRSATRENAFRIVTEYLGITQDDVISIGDGESDVPFFKLAGVSVAMGNAESHVKDAASIVTEHVDRDGVAHFLESVILPKTRN